MTAMDERRSAAGPQDNSQRGNNSPAKPEILSSIQVTELLAVSSNRPLQEDFFNALDELAWSHHGGKFVIKIAPNSSNKPRVSYMPEGSAQEEVGEPSEGTLLVRLIDCNLGRTSSQDRESSETDANLTTSPLMRVEFLSWRDEVASCIYYVDATGKFFAQGAEPPVALTNLIEIISDWCEEASKALREAQRREDEANGGDRTALEVVARLYDRLRMPEKETISFRNEYPQFAEQLSDLVHNEYFRFENDADRKLFARQLMWFLMQDHYMNAWITEVFEISLDGSLPTSSRAYLSDAERRCQNPTIAHFSLELLDENKLKSLLVDPRFIIEVLRLVNGSEHGAWRERALPLEEAENGPSE